MRQDKEINSIHIAKEELKLCLFVDDITVYIESPKESCKKKTTITNKLVKQGFRIQDQFIKTTGKN